MTRDDWAEIALRALRARPLPPLTVEHFTDLYAYDEASTKLYLHDAVAGFGVVTEVRPDGLIEVELSTGDTDEFGGWFCLAIAPWSCRGCGEEFVHSNVIIEEGGDHLIVVWPEPDDPSLLRAAEKRKKRGSDPQIVEYEKSMGKCISFYKLDQHGVSY